MDQNEHQNYLKSLTLVITVFQFLKKVTQLLLSVSVFSFLFSHSSWYSLFFHSFKFYFSTTAFPFQLLAHAMDKNCIFLIFNGILVFLAKTSGLISSPSGFDNNEQLLKKIEDGLQAARETQDSMLAKEILLAKTAEDAVMEENEDVELGREYHEYLIEEEKENSNLTVEDEEREAESGFPGTVGRGAEEEESETYMIENEDNEEEYSENGFLFEEKEEEEEEEEVKGLLSTDELNKKFDDFIRRMKEEIRIGSQQQLVMA